MPLDGKGHNYLKRLCRKKQEEVYDESHVFIWEGYGPMEKKDRLAATRTHGDGGGSCWEISLLRWLQLVE